MWQETRLNTTAEGSIVSFRECNTQYAYGYHDLDEEAAKISMHPEPTTAYMETTKEVLLI